jgi:hypothetical protein
MDDREIDRRVARAAAAVPADPGRLRAQVAARLAARRGWLALPALPGARIALPAYGVALVALPLAVAGWPARDPLTALAVGDPFFVMLAGALP